MPYRQSVEPRSCVVVEGDDRWPGSVLAWQKSPTGWRGLVRFSRTMPEGYPLTFEHWLDAGELEPADPGHTATPHHRDDRGVVEGGRYAT